MSGRRTLLAVDGVINLALGIALVFFPGALVAALGIPTAEPAFYPSVLGGVLVGIGVALLMEMSRRPRGFVGLGLGGAVVINVCAGVILAGWLVLGDLDLPLRGQIFLWSLVLVLVGLSSVELVKQMRERRSEAESD